MAKTSLHDYAKALYEITHDLSGADLKSALQAFAEMLFAKGLITKSALILQEYETVAKRAAGIKSITVTTARPLDKTTLDLIKKTFGAKVEATTAVDESLLGGLVVKTEDTILDASLKTQLRALQEHLA